MGIREMQAKIRALKADIEEAEAAEDLWPCPPFCRQLGGVDFSLTRAPFRGTALPPADAVCKDNGGDGGGGKRDRGHY